MGFLQYVVSRDDVRHICLWFYYYLIDPGHPVTFGVYAGDPVPVRKVKLTSSVSLIKNTGPGRSTQRELLTFRAGGIICIRGSSLRFHTFNCVAPVSWWAAKPVLPFMLKLFVILGMIGAVSAGPARFLLLVSLNLFLYSLIF